MAIRVPNPNNVNSTMNQAPQMQPQPMMPAQAPMQVQVPDPMNMDKAQLKQLKNYYGAMRQPGETFFVEGDVVFSPHVVNVLQGDELAKYNERRGSNYPTTSPCREITIENVQIHNTDGHALTAAECYVLASCYKPQVSEYNPNPTPTYHYETTAVARSPYFAIQDADGSFTRTYPTHELARGLHVILVLRTYTSKQSSGVNMGLNGILICGATAEEAFADFGDTFARDVEALRAHGIILNPATNDAPATYEPGSPEAIAQDEASYPMPGTPVQPQMPVPPAPAPEPYPQVPNYATAAQRPAIPWTPANGGSIVQ